MGNFAESPIAFSFPDPIRLAYCDEIRNMKAEFTSPMTDAAIGVAFGLEIQYPFFQEHPRAFQMLHAILSFIEFEGCKQAIPLSMNAISTPKYQGVALRAIIERLEDIETSKLLGEEDMIDYDALEPYSLVTNSLRRFRDEMDPFLASVTRRHTPLSDSLVPTFVNGIRNMGGPTGFLDPFEIRRLCIHSMRSEQDERIYNYLVRKWPIM